LEPLSATTVAVRIAMTKNIDSVFSSCINHLEGRSISLSHWHDAGAMLEPLANGFDDAGEAELFPASRSRQASRCATSAARRKEERRVENHQISRWQSATTKLIGGPVVCVSGCLDAG
jgi:hypothetical protein